MVFRKKFTIESEEKTEEKMSSIVIPFIGGLAMFIYGMNIMADGLQHAAGSKMKKILEVLTQNKLMGIALGALVTAIIQKPPLPQRLWLSAL